jgi:hypothetical protein
MTALGRFPSVATGKNRPEADVESKENQSVALLPGLAICRRAFTHSGLESLELENQLVPFFLK